MWELLFPQNVIYSPYLGTLSVLFCYHHLSYMQQLQKLWGFLGFLTVCVQGASHPLLWPGFPGVELHACSGVLGTLLILKPWSI